MLYAYVNKIIDISNVDGPGNRTVIFLQGCPFNCLYCHNPETINLCNDCGLCVNGCPVLALSIVGGKVLWDCNLCINCDQCIKVCPSLSSPKVNLYSSDHIINIIDRQLGFIRGITVSGGECMEYPEYLLELFTKVKEKNLSCLIDSNGYYLFENYKELLDISDGVMLDVKAYDYDFHLKLIGRDNTNVFKNLKYLLDHNKLYEVRTVLLPNFDKENIETVIEVSKIIKDRVRYKLLRYRPYGVRKQGIDFIGDIIYNKEKALELKALAIQYGASLTVVI